MPNFRVLKNAIEELLIKAEAARVTANELNRQKTLLKGYFREYAAENNYSLEEYSVTFGDKNVSMRAAESQKVSPVEILGMYTEGLLSDGQLLRIISIHKEEAKKVLGGDIVESISETVKGSELDIRVKQADNPVAANEAVEHAPQPKVTPTPPVKLGVIKQRIMKPRPKVGRLPTAGEFQPLRRSK